MLRDFSQWAESRGAVSRLAAGCLSLALAGCATMAPDGTSRNDTIATVRWPMAEIAPVDATTLSRVEGILATMTLEDKVGQMVQAEISYVTPAEVREYRLGAVLNGGGSFPGKNKYASREDWLALADAFYEASVDRGDGRPGIPVLWGTDAVHGHNGVFGATIFPHNIGLGAAHDPELVRHIGAATAAEVAATGLDWVFAPTLAVVRDDRWGRAYEGYAEDPEIVRDYAAPMVRGLQGDRGAPLLAGRVIATAKHFIGDGGTEGGIEKGDARVDERTLRDTHAAGYYPAIGAGVFSVMVGFNSWQGKRLHGHRYLVADVLKRQMGFDGVVLTDWNGIGQVAGCSNVSCPQAINAGIDMFMVPQEWKSFRDNLLRQIRSGIVSRERIDDAVRRILTLKVRSGLLDAGRPSGRPIAQRDDVLGNPGHRDLARAAVRQSLVLLKNRDGLLPLDPSSRILVAGDAADDIGRQCGGWTLSWQGTGNTNADFPGATSIFDGIRQTVEAAGGIATLSADGEFSRRPDAAIVVFGEAPYAEGFGDIKTLDFEETDGDTLATLRRLRARGVPVVAIFITGRPMWVNPELNASDAFVVAWLPGSEGGGIADVLFSDASGRPRFDFTGRLSFSWPASPAQATINRGDPDYAPLFAYGFGLDYGSTDRLDDDLPAHFE